MDPARCDWLVVQFRFTLRPWPFAEPEHCRAGRLPSGVVDDEVHAVAGLRAQRNVTRVGRVDIAELALDCQGSTRRSVIMLGSTQKDNSMVESVLRNGESMQWPANHAARKRYALTIVCTGPQR